ncbi:hypothetical protein FRAHR75_320028 [Frankia sp. Hr75.2]|nr:hypothetical protein FRAHR75_320028 [Frankia sp. Hr75.2]
MAPRTGLRPRGHPRQRVPQTVRPELDGGRPRGAGAPHGHLTTVPACPLPSARLARRAGAVHYAVRAEASLRGCATGPP